MKRRSLPGQGWLALALLLAACGGDPPVRLPQLAPTAKILAFGDSLTSGVGASGGSSYPDILAQHTGRVVINAGVSGETSAQGKERLADVLDAEEPDLVVLCLGGNDMLRRMDRKILRQNLADMIRQIRGRGVPVVLLGVPEPRLIGLESEPLYRSLAAEFGLPLEERVIAEVLGRRSLRSDEIHPNDSGYRQIAEAVAELLKKSGAI